MVFGPLTMPTLFYFRGGSMSDHETQVTPPDWLLFRLSPPPFPRDAASEIGVVDGSL